MSADLEVVQVRGLKGSSSRQKATIESLRLGRIGRRATHPDTPEVRGMIQRVAHLVRVDGGPS